MRIKLPSFKEIALESYIFEILVPKNIGRPSFMQGDFCRNYAKKFNSKRYFGAVAGVKFPEPFSPKTRSTSFSRPQTPITFFF